MPTPCARSGEADSNCGESCQAEGFPVPPTYGGSDDSHNCGTLAYVRVGASDGSYDIWAKDLAGGEPYPLIVGPGVDDGPEPTVKDVLSRGEALFDTATISALG